MEIQGLLYASLRLLAAASLLGALAVTMPASAVAANDDYLVYLGTYTRKDSKGIYAHRFNTATGKLTPLGVAAELANPSFLAIHPNGRFLYAVTEASGDGGAVSAYSIDHQSGKLTFLNQASAKGGGPCHLNVDQTGRMLVVANYGSGSVAALPVKEDGRLGEATGFAQHSGSSVDPRRQKGPHAHSVNFSPDNRFVVAADLGLDQLLVYRVDPAKGSLVANDPPYAKVPPGGGPRHFAFHPTARYAYAINEMGNTVTAFTYDAEGGVLREVQTTTTLPEDFSDTSHTAEVVVHPSGRFLYGSNRGHDSIAVFAIDAGTGKLTLVELESTQGKTPRNFAIDPTGAYLFAANQASDSVVLFRINQNTGALNPTGETINVPAPVCVRFVKLP